MNTSVVLVINMGHTMKNTNDIFDGLTPDRFPEKFEIEVYRDDFDLLNKFIAYKQEKLGGRISTAVLFNRMTRAFLADIEFSKSAGFLASRRKNTASKKSKLGET